MFVIVFALRGPDRDHRFWTGDRWTDRRKQALAFNELLDAHAEFNAITRPLCFNANTFLVADYRTDHERIVLSVGTTDTGAVQLLDHTARSA